METTEGSGRYYWAGKDLIKNTYLKKMWWSNENI